MKIYFLIFIFTILLLSNILIWDCRFELYFICEENSKRWNKKKNARNKTKTKL